MVESRTAKSLKNSVVALLFYFINLGLQFFSRKIFLEHLGAEVLGLNTTATNLLQFLNLAELGVGAAIGYSLYKPLAEKNRQQINEIVSVQGYLYYKIGLFVGGIAVLLMFSSIVVSGIQLITKEKLTGRNITIVSVALGLGYGLGANSDILRMLPDTMQLIFGGSGIVPAAIVALVLNIVLPKDEA